MGFHFSSEAPIKEGVFKLSSVLLAGGYAIRFNQNDIVMERYWLNADNFRGKIVECRTDDGYDLLIMQSDDGKTLTVQTAADVGESTQKQGVEMFKYCLSTITKVPGTYQTLKGLHEETGPPVPSGSI
eukprot:Protomagalhaensia_sp_Gyna_25__661@NODE_1309_length_1957_cov_50_867049_g871_i2_p2_GENE_NODE_1309_length_1957_cov_50_867049_g871_i2NODE_1309_length_1957_cov_50_867049_g871_i2_p2_ORF_typecomplete_len128_score13_13Lysozyme_like/PF13702_6/4_6e03Lysozyme_like/PF13702_6/0_11NigD_N/PF12667_7/0_099_NODE_1309_length_1957_cov_50_867049_g871_i210731456